MCAAGSEVWASGSEISPERSGGPQERSVVAGEPSGGPQEPGVDAGEPTF